ncbi:MAG: GNAT family N-acetyltransferase [Acidimicrobiales bacterium]
MAVEIRRAVQDDLPQLYALDYRNFGVTDLPTEQELAEDMLDPDRFLVAFDGGDMVAAGGSFQMELTVPGSGPDNGAFLPMSGVTWVSVAASHRRQGILRRLMGGLDEMAVELEEPILGLTASEGAIYERFGYGVATRSRVIELDRRRAQIDPKWEPEPVRLIEGSKHVEELQALFERYRPTQVGEVSRPDALFREQNIEKDKANFAAIHPDGYATWETQPDWAYGHPRHVLTIRDFVAVTPEARIALWNILLSIDLVGPIRSIRSVALDDSLPFMLTDPRALRTIESNDFLWLKTLDAARCFEARSFRTDDRLVIDIRDGADDPVERIAISSASCGPTDEPADIVAYRSALGPLLLGVHASHLAAGRRLAGDHEIIERADLMLGTGRLAHCRTSF